MKDVVAFAEEGLADRNHYRWLVEGMRPLKVPGGWVVGHLGRTVPCCQFPDACHFSCLPALAVGSLWEVEHRVLQTYEVVVLGGWEK